MNQKTRSRFDRIIKEYDCRDLLSLITFSSILFQDGDSKQDEYEGAKNLFSKILSLYKYSSSNREVDFLNEKECNIICNDLFDYLINKYWEDHSQLNKCVTNNLISEKQLLYEISSPKTYPKTFIDTLDIKLRPFNSFLSKRYHIDSGTLKEKCEFLIKNLLQGFSSYDVMNHITTNITNYFPTTLLDDLMSVNEKITNLNDINSFSKIVCFPVVKIGDEYHLTSAEVFIDNFYKSIHRLFSKLSTQAEKDDMANNKGQLFNDSCELIFNNFGFEEIYSNYCYKNGELDILIPDRDVLFLIECKSRNYTDKLSGIDNSYIKANDSNLDSASRQLHRFIDLLNEKNSVTLHKNDKKITFNKDKFNYIIPLVINIENFAELNADFVEREKGTIYLSFDDLYIIADVIKNKKWLLVDFLTQMLTNNEEAPVDDVIDMFAFYCQCKNLTILFSDNTVVFVYKLGNDYFQSYFSYQTKTNPILTFDNDIYTYRPNENMNYKEIVEGYHKTYWKEITDLIKD